MGPNNESTSTSPYAILKIKDFRFYLTSRFANGFGNQMLTFAVAWELWNRTQSAFSLGLIGLCLVLPIISLALPAGHVADNYERRRIVMTAQGVIASSEIFLALLTIFSGPVFLVYVGLVLIGSARAFNEPAASTLMPLCLPPELFSKAATWTSSVFQTASIVGSAAAGLVVALSGSVVPAFLIAASCALINLLSVSRIKGRQVSLARKSLTTESLWEGINFLRSQPILLGAITLDLFAVLFGGAVALMPIYATDVLQMGAQGLGLMRAAPAVGALLMALVIAHVPPFRKAGRALLWSVSGFGVATIVFGFSPWFPLSLAMLLVLGALDSVSVVIRSTLMLTLVPDEMRGRTASVNSIFIASSNELGDFESGVLAGLIGPVATVIAGGFGTLAVVGLITRKFKALRDLGSL